MKLSTILTVFNRKEKTLNCLTSLFNITHDIDVYLVDDGSTDGTWDAVKEKFPQVNLIKGNGNLFWSRGMYTAWKEAVKGDYDAYIWLNDDQKLRSNFLEELFSVEQENNWNCIVTGRIADIESGEIIYCGYDNNKKGECFMHSPFISAFTRIPLTLSRRQKDCFPKTRRSLPHKAADQRLKNMAYRLPFLLLP